MYNLNLMTNSNVSSKEATAVAIPPRVQRALLWGTLRFEFLLLFRRGYTGPCLESPDAKMRLW